MSDSKTLSSAIEALIEAAKAVHDAEQLLKRHTPSSSTIELAEAGLGLARLLLAQKKESLESLVRSHESQSRRNAEEIERLKEAHAEEIRRLKEAHAEETQGLKEAHEEENAKNKADIADLNRFLDHHGL